MMDLNNIQLTPGLVSDLYRSALVESETSGENDMSIHASVTFPEPAREEKLKHLGNNKKNILIAVNHSNITHLPDEDLAFLTKILAACKLNLDDVAIVNTNNFPGYTYKEYDAGFNTRIILLFGIEPAGFGLPLNFPHFQVQNFSKYTFLYSPSLNDYDDLLKSKLWVSLKRIFGV